MPANGGVGRHHPSGGGKSGARHCAGFPLGEPLTTSPVRFCAEPAAQLDDYIVPDAAVFSLSPDYQGGTYSC
jgi:hypothetical protein